MFFLLARDVVLLLALAPPSVFLELQLRVEADFIEAQARVEFFVSAVFLFAIFFFLPILFAVMFSAYL